MTNPAISQQQTLKKLTGHTDWVRSLAVLQDGTLASCSDDGTIRLWNTTTGEVCKTLAGHTDWVRALVVLQDGTLVSGSDDRTIILWDMAVLATMSATTIDDGTDDRQGYIQTYPSMSAYLLTCRLPDVVDEEGDGMLTRSKTRKIANRIKTKDIIVACHICLDPLITERIKLPGCSHVFHHKCIVAWLRNCVNNDCPLCRMVL